MTRKFINGFVGLALIIVGAVFIPQAARAQVYTYDPYSYDACDGYSMPCYSYDPTYVSEMYTYDYAPSYDVTYNIQPGYVPMSSGYEYVSYSQPSYPAQTYQQVSQPTYSYYNPYQNQSQYSMLYPNNGTPVNYWSDSSGPAPYRSSEPYTQQPYNGYGLTRTYPWGDYTRCYWGSDYGYSSCNFDPHQRLYDPWTDSWY